MNADKTTQAAAGQALAEQQMLYVTDTLCAADPSHPHHVRVHSHMIGSSVRQFRFKYDERVAMPFAHAVKFLKEPAFLVEERVSDNSFIRYEPPPADLDPHAAPRSARIKLGDDEVIAKWNELTLEALVIRANMKPGGEKMRRADGKDALISFLAECRKSEEAALAAARGKAALNDDEFVPEPETGGVFDEAA